MPHRCTKCGRVYSDGDSVILTGCPECKWNKFLYVKNEAVSSLEEPDDEDDLLEDDWADDDSTESDGLIEHEIEILMKNQDEKDRAMNSALENIDKALNSTDVQKDLDPNRVDSIRILDTGSYELNLESILNNEDIVIGIKEEGQYAIDLPVILQKSNKAAQSKKKK